MRFQELWSFFAYYYFCLVILVVIVPVLLVVLFGNVDGYFGKGVATTFVLTFIPLKAGFYLFLPSVLHTLAISFMMEIVRGYDWLVVILCSLLTTLISITVIYQSIEQINHIDLLLFCWFFVCSVFLSLRYYRSL